MLSCEVVEQFAELASLEREWDELAVACEQPLSRPAWLRSWWNASCGRADHPGRALRVAVVTDAGRLAGVLPLFLVERGARLADMRALGDGGFWNSGPAVDPRGAPEILAAAARALRETRPQPARLIFANVPRSAAWPRELARRWPGGARLALGGHTESLVVDGGGPSADWLASRPRAWRAEIRRRERRAAEEGFEMHCAEDRESMRSALAELVRLHHARWQGRSQWLRGGMENAVTAACSELIDSGAVRLWSLSRPGELIGVTLFVSGGRTSQVLLTAFDPRWGTLAPGLLTNVAGIRRELDDGAARIDLGYGDYQYKRLLATGREALARFELFPLGWRYPLARTRWPSERVRRQIARLS